MRKGWTHTHIHTLMFTNNADHYINDCGKTSKKIKENSS